MLAVSAALVAQRVQRDTQRVIEARGRLVLSLAARTELRMERLRSALAGVAPLADGGIPDDARLAEMFRELQGRDPAFTRLEVVDGTGGVLRSAPGPGTAREGGMHGAFPWLADAARAEELAGGLYPDPDGAARILLSWRLTPEGRGTHLRAEADARALPAATEGGAGIALYYVAPGGAVFAPAAGTSPPPGRETRLALDSLAKAARRTEALAQREVPWPDETTRIAVAAPLRDDSVSLVLLVPKPAPDQTSKTLPTTFLALAGVLLVLLPLLRKTRRR